MNAVIIALSAVAVLLLPPSAARRLGSTKRLSKSSAEDSRWSVARIIIVLLLGAATALVIAGGSGIVAGAIVTGVSYVLLTRSAKSHITVNRRRRLAQIPLTLEVAAMLLRSGATPSSALSSAAGAVGPLLCDDIGQVARLQQMGQDAHSAWSLLVADPVLAPVAQSAIRSSGSGSALATDWERVAADCRQQYRAEAHGVAQRAGIFALAPLGLCFLPAFVCLGVVPIVLGLTTDVFG